MNLMGNNLMKKIFLVLFLISTVLFAQNKNPFAVQPDLNYDGTKLAFSYQGDIWTVPVAGGKAFRLTVNNAYDGYPIWSPDGKLIAFASNRYGNNDVYTINSNGGVPKRLTFHSTSDNPTGWTSEKRILFETSRVYKKVERTKEIFSISIDGGTESRYLDALGNYPVESLDGKFIAFTQGGCKITRETYKGPANKNIWIYKKADNTYHKLTTFEGQDFLPKWDKNGNLYFLSARSGKYNVYKVRINDNGEADESFVQLTNFTNEGIRSFDVSENGKKIVIERKDNIYTMDLESKKIAKVNIEISADYHFYPYEWKTFTSGLTDYAVSPDGKLSVFVVHGEVFVTQNKKDRSKSINLSKSSYREKDVAWVNNEVVIFASDKDGKFDLYTVSSADPKEKNIFRSLKHKIRKITDSAEEERSPIISPDGKKIAFLRGNNHGVCKLIVAKIAEDGSISDEKVLSDGWAQAKGITWSPDSKWLAYSKNDLNFNSEIYIQAADGSKKAVNVSMHPRGDYNPVWSPDGSKLGFISERSSSQADVWFVWLTKKDWEKNKEEWKEESDNDSSKKKSKKDEKTKPIKIDFDNIYERIEHVTYMAGNESSPLFSKDGKTIYFTTNQRGKSGRDLFSVKWDGTKIKPITKTGISPRGLSYDKSYKNIYFVGRGGRFARLNLAGNRVENLPIVAKMKIDFVTEKEEIFEEGWRALRDGFYDPKFHGRDWNKIKETYKPYCLKASTDVDFQVLYNWMLGQLDASHMGFRGPVYVPKQRERTGLLGIEIQPLTKGVKITHVVLDSPADKLESKLSEGDVILKINEQDITNKTNFWSLLTNTANSKILLTVKTQNGIKEIPIWPTTSLRNKLYNEWVKERRALTDKYSNGRLGYLHIQGMNLPSFERFERELAAAGYGKEGIVIDVRFNGGGWTTDYLMAILNVKQHAYTIPRGATDDLSNHLKYREYYPFAERLPFYAWTKPSVAICNSSSYSNAEIFSHAYKTLGIGKLVGQATFGAVISTSSHPLVNGSYVRMPYRAWFVKATDENMEWGPAVPNYELMNAPDSKAKGVDEQLKKAVDVLLQQIDNK